MLTDQLVINLTHEDKDTLRAIAREHEMPLAAVTRRIIRAELARLREGAERPAGNSQHETGARHDQRNP
jgi:hypothetical protein